MQSDPRRFPFPIPDGWFRVAFADECKPGRVEPLRYFGRDLVLVVTESGAVQVFDAYCPHLGAHVGHGGSVVGESVRCPFHAWRFGLDGRCVEVPYAKCIPASARLRAWPTQVSDGIVWVWHHRCGEPPSWELPAVPEFADPAWTPYLHHRWRVRTRNQEIAENTSDPAHFRVVHGFPQVAPPEIRFEAHRCRSATGLHREAPGWRNGGSRSA